jgi:2-(1,2-epoxy-1,2-dihydrophenyl)acetyl-CoA isomerase
MNTSSDYEMLRVERDGGLLRVTLANAAKFNALSTPLRRSLKRCFSDIGADTAVRAVLLAADGKAFCSGADLTEGDGRLLPAGPRGQEVAARLREELNPIALALHRLPVPLVVAVNGIAAGAGVALALAGDYVVAASSASFRILFAPRLGLVPDMGATWFVTRAIGATRSRALSLTGAPLAASDAAAAGLIAECVDDAALEARALAVARQFAAGPTRAFVRLRDLIESGASASLEEQLEREAVAQQAMADSEDFVEGVLAFREKREPRFNGR